MAYVLARGWLRTALDDEGGSLWLSSSHATSTSLTLTVERDIYR